MRILVVEDEVGLARTLKLGLEAEGFDADVAHDGNDGFVMAQSQEYDAIVLDILLPGMNGYRVCAELRKAGNWTPILMLTAKDGEHDEAEALDTGADDYLSKPFSYVVLLARLRALIRRGLPPRPALREVGNLILDPATRRCERAGDEISLTRREYSVLELLMRRSPNVVERGEILDAVWGLDAEVDPNVLDVYIGQLRRKIDAPFGLKTLETLRGIGYRLIAEPVR